MIAADTYMKWARVPISTLGDLPEGWRHGLPHVSAAFFDMLMSRWLDDVVIASNMKENVDADGKKEKVLQTVGRLKVKVSASTVMLWGEATAKTCKVRLYLDGKLIEKPQEDGNSPLQEWDLGWFAKIVKGNVHLNHVVATNLDTTVDHVLEIEPVFTGGEEQELRLESICVAGGRALVVPLPQ